MLHAVKIIISYWQNSCKYYQVDLTHMDNLDLVIKMLLIKVFSNNLITSSKLLDKVLDKLQYTEWKHLAMDF